MSSAAIIMVEPTRIRAVSSKTTPKPCRVVRLSPGRLREWDEYVQAHAEGTFFHQVGWRNAVWNSFGHRDLYLVAVRDERIVGGLPLFLVKSRIAGRLLVSVPYAVGGGILADDDEVSRALFEEGKRLVHMHECVAMDLRSERAAVTGVPIVEGYVGFTRRLPDSSREVPGWLPRKARAAARNARNKFGLTVSYGDHHLDEVWRLYSLSMRRLGSLAYPRSFFECLLAETPGRHWVSVVSRNGRPVAGLVTFLFRDSVMPYFIGTTDDARRCSAANFIYLTVMERGVEHGYRLFDFGRSRRGNAGSFDFKRFHGFAPRPLQYQSYLRKGCAAPHLSPDSPRYRLARRIWRRLPLIVTQSLGAAIAKHVPG